MSDRDQRSTLVLQVNKTNFDFVLSAIKEATPEPSCPDYPTRLSVSHMPLVELYIPI